MLPHPAVIVSSYPEGRHQANNNLLQEHQHFLINSKKIRRKMKLTLLKCKHDKRERCHIQILLLQEKVSMSICSECLTAQNKVSKFFH